VPRTLAVAFFGMLITAVGYAIFPRSDTWLIPLVCTVGMAYLVYCVIFYSTTAYINRLPDTSANADKDKEKQTSLSDLQMKEICDKVMNYLTASGAHTNPDLSLSMISVEIGISHTNISRSINGYLKKNFLDIVNKMRVEEVKKGLRALGDNYTIDSIAEKCGFQSRTSFFRSFKEYEGTTPAKWLKLNK
jgi:YesN/AraC family two-component response regulator